MSTYVLVHGAWHGAWCWYKLLPRLRRAGHEVIALDLPGLGRDTTPVGQVSLESWTNTVCDALGECPGRAILVGHSRGGLVIGAVAEKQPKKVEALVYVTAALVRNGQSMRELLKEDASSLMLPNLLLSEDGASSTVKDEALKDTFYGECAEEDVALARLLLRPEPRAPGGTPIFISEDRFGSVPRYYIECLRDRAIPLALQRRMCAASPCAGVMSIDTDHSPFFSAPDKLTEHLLSVFEATTNAA